jgi:hypothetical protein
LSLNLRIVAVINIRAGVNAKRGMKYAIRIPSNDSLEREIAVAYKPVGVYCWGSGRQNGNLG